MWFFHKHDWREIVRTYVEPIFYKTGNTWGYTEHSIMEINDKIRLDAKGSTTIVWKCASCQKFHKEILAGKVV